MLFLKVEIDQWRSSGKVPFVATLLLASVSVWRTRLGRVLIDAARSGVRPSCELNPQGLFLPGGRLFRRQSRGVEASANGDLLRFVSHAPIRGVTKRVGQFIDKRIEKSGASANPQVQAKPERQKNPLPRYRRCPKAANRQPM